MTYISHRPYMFACRLKRVGRLQRPLRTRVAQNRLFCFTVCNFRSVD